MHKNVDEIDTKLLIREDFGYSKAINRNPPVTKIICTEDQLKSP